MKTTNLLLRKNKIFLLNLFFSLIYFSNIIHAQQIELLVNGNFSATNSGWTKFQDFYYDSRFSFYNFGPGYAYLSTPTGGTAPNLGGDIHQTLTIPANATSATLSYYTFIGTLDSLTVKDHLSIFFIYNTNQVYTIKNLTNLDYTSAYVQQPIFTIPSSLFGIPITLYFEGTTSPTSAGTKFRVDDVSLKYIPGPSCSYSLSINSTSIGSGSASGNFTVNTSSGCPWSAVSNAPSWLHTSSSSNGPGVCSYTVDANPGPARNGTITTQGQIFTVNQAGTSCSYSLSSYTTSIGSGSASGNFTVNTSSGCPWSAVSNDPSWLHTLSSSNGPGVCSYTVDANPGPARNGTITTQGQVFTINQAGTSCSYSLSSYTTSIGSGSASGNFTVNTSSGCPWSAVSNDPSWLHTLSSSNGPGVCSYTVDANPGPARNGTITTQGQVFTVSQAGTLPPTYLDISDVRVYANNILLSSGNTYIVSGNVYAVPRTGCSTPSEVLHFTGATIFVNQSSNTISASAGTVYCSGIGSHGTVNLFSGAYTLHAVNDILYADIFDLSNTLFKLANLDLELNSMQVLCNGVVLNGNVTFPDALTYFATAARLNLNLTTLYLTTSGINLAGGLSLVNLKLSRNLNLESLDINFNSSLDEFSGGTRLKTPAFNINAEAAIRNGQLDEIGLGFANTYNVVPLFSTGLAIDSVGGGLQNISTPNLNLYLGARISPYTGFTIPSLANLRIEANYSLGTSFNAWGKFSLFNHAVANTGFTVSPGLFQLSGDLDLLNTLKAHANLSVSNNTNYVKLLGIFNANLSVPPLLPSWLSIINSFYAGKTLASTNNYLTNEYLAGTGKISIIGAPRLFYNLEWDNGWSFKWGKDITLLPIEAQSQIGPFRISNAYRIHSFEVNTITESLIISGKGSGLVPELTLYLMNGDTIGYSNFLSHEGVNYFTDTINSISSISVSNPVLGNYYISSIDADSIFVTTQNQQPSIFIDQVINNSSIRTLDVSFSCFDPDDNAHIMFGLDIDKNDANGFLLTDSVVENGNSGNIVLDYSNVKTGDYYLYAIAIDSIGHLVYSYSEAPINIVASNAPNSPQNLIVSSNSSTINIGFDKNNSVPLNYLVYYSSTPGTINSSSKNFSLGDTNTADINFLNPGYFYEFAISSIDTNGNESQLSNIASTNFISSSNNNYPKFATLNCGSKAHIGSNYTCTILSNDSDNDPINYTIQSGPSNLTINNSGIINWNPTINEIGFNDIYVKITDGNGGSDSLYFQILVLDTANNSPTSAFDRSSYFDYTNAAIINIYDPELDTVNQVSIQITSNSDNLGITTTGHKNGQVYVKRISLSNVSSNDSTLLVMPGDTMRFSYTSLNSGKSTTNFAHFDFFKSDFISLDTICGNDSLVVYNISKGNNLSYDWDFGDSTASSHNKNPKHLFPQVPGSGFNQYLIRLKISNPEGQIDSISKLIYVRQLPNTTISTQGNLTFCKGDSVLLQATAGLTYQWQLNGDPILNANNESFYAKETGTYICHIYSNLTCSIQSDSIQVAAHLLPTINLGNDTIINSGSSLMLNAGSGFASYLWSTGDTTQTIIIHSPDTFSVIITDQNNCSNIDSIIVNLGTEISNPTNNRDISIYPNPSNGKFILEFNSQDSEKKMIELFDILGQRVFHKFCGSDNRISIEMNHPPGIYILSVKGKNEIKRKIIIE